MEKTYRKIDPAELATNMQRYMDLAERGLLLEVVEQHTDDGLGLPDSLVHNGYFNLEAFQKAVRRGFVVRTDEGGMAWLLGSKTLLAYFIGRVCCGDTAEEDIANDDNLIWNTSQCYFPESFVKQAFGMTNVREIRKQRSGRSVPKGHEDIDLLLD